jgi:hypothetical protein
MMAQAAGELGAVVRRWKCDGSMGKWRGTGSNRQWSVAGAHARCGRALQHLPRSGLVQRGLFPAIRHVRLLRLSCVVRFLAKSRDDFHPQPESINTGIWGRDQRAAFRNPFSGP